MNSGIFFLTFMGFLLLELCPLFMGFSSLNYGELFEINMHAGPTSGMTSLIKGAWGGLSRRMSETQAPLHGTEVLQLQFTSYVCCIAMLSLP